MIVLIDLSSIYWAAWHAAPDQSVSVAQQATLEAVARWSREPAGTAIAVDAPPYRRRTLDAAYKGQREAHPPQALDLLRRTVARLEADGYPVLSSPGEEADDVIATVVGELGALEEIAIVSGDKDLAQLVALGVTQHTPRGASLDPPAVAAKFGVGPALLGDWLALVGDASDNVRGVPGVGPKRATALLLEHHSLEAILAAAAEGRVPGAVGRALVEHASAARLARELVRLRTDCPLPDGWREALRAPRVASPLYDADPITDDCDPDQTGDDAMTDNVPPTDTSAPTSAPDSAPAPAVAVEPPTQSTAIATVPTAGATVAWQHGLEPASLAVASKLATALANSRLYARFPNADAILAVIIRGRELGLGALTALDVFHVVEGRPVPHAHLIVARAESHPDCEYIRMVESTDESATYETKHRAHPTPTRLVYTLAQAQQAGRAPAKLRSRAEVGERDSRSQWEKMPAEMLRKTCAVQLVRIVYPSAALGLYAVEELES